MKVNVAEFVFTIQDGGAETLVKDYCLLLNKEKFNTIVIVIRRSPNTANHKILMERGVKIISICKNNSIPFKIIQRLNYWWYVPYRLRRIIKQENINVIHIHMALLKYINRLSDYINKMNIRICYTCHNLPILYFCGKNKNEGKSAKHLIEHNGLQLIALHNDMKNEIDKMFGVDNTAIIHNGIDFNRYKNIKESKISIRNAIGIPQEAFVIGHIGRFIYQKNHEFLVDVFADVYKKNARAFLLMIGTGKLINNIKTKLKKLGLEDRTLILSHRSDIPQLLKAMDVFVFPSRWEGLSVTLVEAQVVGLRCIVSNKVNMESIISKNTILVDINDSSKVWCDVIMNNTIQGFAYSKMENYDMNKEIKRLEKLYLGE